VILLALVAVASLARGALAVDSLQHDLEAVSNRCDGRMGIGVRQGNVEVAVHGDQRFALQSVMKLVVGAAAFAAAETSGWKLDETVTIHREDLSLFVQPLARLVTANGFTTTLDDLVLRAVAQSDSAATDILFARLGGAPAIGEFLARHGIDGLRVDRDERHLQTELCGLEWRPEFVDADLLQRAIDNVPEVQRDAAFHRALYDERDTTTPIGMVAFLHALTSGTLLRPAGTERLLTILRATSTFPDRLKAGAPEGWVVGHKTGTSGTWKGVTAVTNDVGFLVTPDGVVINVAVFVAESRQPADARAALIAEVARAVVRNYR
jgi:beta-lactamase class A